MRPLIAALIFTLACSSVWALQISGIEMPTNLTTQDHATVQLNGAGVREKWFMDLYVAGLYLEQPSRDADSILQSDQPMAIRLNIISGVITSKKMTRATLEGFENSTQSNTEPFAEQIELFLSAFQDEISNGDVFEFIYHPGSGISILKNATKILTIESGLPFKQALFGIWLCDKPAQKSLKQAMLGL